MSNRDYPRIDHATRKPKWDKLRIQHPKQAKSWQCCVCAQPATHQAWVQVSWFRGEDEGPFKACGLHMADATALLASKALKEQQA